MKEWNKGIIPLMMMVVLISCQSNVDLDKVIDRNSSLYLTRLKTDKETGLSAFLNEEIKVNSDKWKKLMEFAHRNNEGWQLAPASYTSVLYVRQDNFTLILTKDSKGIVVSYIDTHGKARQYSKWINKGELNFLTED